MHSDSGWIKPLVIKAYFDHLVTWCEPPFALVLDVFSSHRDKTVKEYDRQLGIDLIFRPLELEFTSL